MIRVVLVDDHEVVRAGIGHLLSTVDGIEVVGAASDGDEALGVVDETRPDVVLMDLSMPRVDGIEAIAKIAATHPQTSTVALTSFSDRERILNALDAGAVGYLLKDAEPDELFRGVQAAARGESPLAPKAAHAVLTARTERQPAADLSDRELEVLKLVAEGFPNKRIARELEISEKTVKAHLTNIFQRIGVTDRTQAALWAQRNGIA
jgi:DNA-binding NarL/FixJ family response regulator